MKETTTLRLPCLILGLLLGFPLFVVQVHAAEFENGVLDHQEQKYNLFAVNGRKGAIVARAPFKRNDYGDRGAFPSIIKVPPDATAKVKADIGNKAASAKRIYLLYFSRHSGNQIFVKWSKNKKGPYKWIVNPKSPDANDRNSVLYFKNNRHTPINGEETVFDHIGMPDIHKSQDGKQFILIFHGEIDMPGIGSNHASFISISDNPLHFDDGVMRGIYEDGSYRPVPIADAYLRVFNHKGKYYGMTKKGELFDVPDSCDFERGLISQNKNETMISDFARGEKKFDWDMSKEVSDGLFYPSTIFEYLKNEFGIGIGNYAKAYPNHPFPVSRGKFVEIFFWIKKDDRFMDLYSILLDPEQQWEVVENSFKTVVTPNDMDTVYGKKTVKQIGDAYLFENKYLFFAYGKRNQGFADLPEGYIGVMKLKS